jgi:hypothetical protein
MNAWERLRSELDLWADSGRVAELWWRDDDATEVTPALERLLRIAREASTPLALAVIPAAATRELLETLGAESRISVLQHGVAHVNHAPAGEKKSELGEHRDTEVILADLAKARRHLASLGGDGPPGVLVPPWNRIAPNLLPRLPAVGFHGLSVFGARVTAQPAARLREANTHADLIDWRGSRGFAGADSVLGAMVTHLAARRRETSDRAEPTGLLTHHIVHDEACWRFVASLLDATAGHPAVRWLGAAEIFPKR